MMKPVKNTFRTMMKRFLKHSLYLAALVVVVMSTFTGTSHAENACADTKGTSARKITIQVTTGNTSIGKASIKFTQTKGTMKIHVLRLDYRDYDTTKSMHEYYLITLKKLGKYGYYQQGMPIKWSGTSSKTISLDKNSTYQITIEPYSVKYKKDMDPKWGPAMNPYPCTVVPLKLWAARGWTKHCTWKAVSCSKIKTCKVITK